MFGKIVSRLNQILKFFKTRLKTERNGKTEILMQLEKMETFPLLWHLSRKLPLTF